MNPDFAEIAEHLILFEHRVAQGYVEFSPDQLSISGGTVFGDFLRFLERIYPAVRIDDLALIATEFLRTHPSLPNWYEAVLASRNLKIGFENGEPQIRSWRSEAYAQNCHEWMDLSARICPDAIIALQYALTFERPFDEHDIRNWGVYARIYNNEVISQPMWLRFRDLHTHLSGCESSPLVWQELLAEQITLERLPAYNRAHPSNKVASDRFAAEKAAILRALKIWRPVLRCYDLPSRDVSVTDIRRSLWRERVALIDQWRLICQWSNQADRNKPQLLRLMSHLDKYLFGKNKYVSRHIQSPNNNPGLENFRRNFDMLKIIGQRKTDRVVRQYFKRWRDFAFDAPTLDHVEFRIAPVYASGDRSVAQEYRRYLRNFKEVFLDVSAKPPRPGISGRSLPRVVVHFTRPQMDLENAQAGIDLHRLRYRLDTEAAGLYHFLNQPDVASEEKKLRKLIVGLDVCNIERNAPIEYFASYLKILRTQRLKPPFKQFLEMKPKYFERLCRAKQSCAASGERAGLGLTVHSGEDYYHPLIGLRDIWNAVTLCEMRSGDRIGHGLALGTDIGLYTRQMGASAVIPRGLILDSAVWMHRRLGTLSDIDLRVHRALEDVISDLTRKIYGRSHTIDDMKRLFEIRQAPGLFSEVMQPRYRKLFNLNKDDCALKLYCEETFNEVCKRKRSELATLPAEFNNPWIIDAIEQLQTMLCKKIIEKGIVIELNPTSNRSVGDFDNMIDHPVLRLKLKHPALRVAVGCDDPGNFGTRIENEFALVAQGLRAHRVSEEKAEQIIRDMIETGRKNVFGRLTHSNDVRDWDNVGGELIRHNPDTGPD